MTKMLREIGIERAMDFPIFSPYPSKQKPQYIGMQHIAAKKDGGQGGIANVIGVCYWLLGYFDFVGNSICS